MHLEIHGERLISEIQRDFNTLYPYLKIQFFKKNSKRRNAYTMNSLIPPTWLLKEISVFRKDKDRMEFWDEMSVHEFENTLMKEFGLPAQVFRKSGNLWLETTMTGEWTLRQQNDHGKEITVHIAGHR